jgi:endopolyphosphatase
MDWLDEDYKDSTYESGTSLNDKDDKSISKKKKKGKKHKKPKTPDFIIPSPPSKSTPPGPAYSPQTLTLLGYTQYFANLTHINNDIVKAKDFEGFEDSDDDIETEGWREGKHKGKHPKDKIPHPNIFKYEVEYSTFNDSIFKLKDMTVRSYIKLAHRIGQYKPSKGDHIAEDWLDEEGDDFKDFNEVKFEDGYDNNIDNVDSEDVETEKKKKKHKKKHHHHQNDENKVWLNFIKRAFVGTMEDEELGEFEHVSPPSLQLPDHRTEVNVVVDVHDGEM